MKKKYFVLLCLMLAAVLVLCGCECKHEWKAADCLTAQTCTKCEVTEGEPLGHDWQAATCEAPETCSRCGETQGEKLEHVYGEWVMGETDMSRSCQNCAGVEKAEIDRELYLYQQLEGHWDFQLQLHGEEIGHAYEMEDDYQFYNLHVDMENGSWWHDGETAEAVTIQFEEYQKSDSSELYVFSCVFSDESKVYLVYSPDLDQIITKDGEYSYFFSKHEDLEDALVGLWAEVEKDSVSFLELKPDRTFTAEVPGEALEGTWHLRGLISYTTNYSGDTVYQRVDIDFAYEKDGKPAVKSITMSAGEKDDGRELKDKVTEGGIGLNMFENYAYVKKMDVETFEMLKEANKNGAEKILGKWDSTSTYVYVYNGGGSTTTPATDYTITFREDGTFEAAVDQAYTGTWEFRSAYLSGSSFSYSYDLLFDGVEKSVNAHISGNGELSLSTSDDEASRSVDFKQFTPEEKAQLEAETEKAKTVIIGQWTSFTSYEYTENGGSEKATTDYTITFNADGTFTINLEEGTSGTWKFEEVNINKEHGFVSYDYALTLDGYGGYVSMNIQSGDIEILNFSMYQEPNERSITFNKAGA